MTKSTIDVDKALLDPSSCFETPEEVIEAAGLSREQRVAILKSWERDARELAVAEEEGMGDGEASLLRRVLTALGRLGVEAGGEPAPYGKQGG
jgi:hypothetical protein